MRSVISSRYQDRGREYYGPKKKYLIDVFHSVLGQG